MQAVIRAGGHQFIVSPNQTIEIDLVDDVAKELNFAPLLVIDGDKISVGTPEVAGMTVRAKVVGEVKGDKLKVLKFKPKKRITKTTGHRQRYTQITITAIEAAKPKPAAAKTAAVAKTEKPKAKEPAAAAA